MIAALCAAVLMTPMNFAEDLIRESPAQRTKRMKWFKEARFGMFIHWGLYAVPAGKWKDSTGHGEWIMETGQVPIADYDKWRTQFNPTKFNAMEWVRMAKSAGMKYITITTKHHDGFALYDSKLTDWDIMSTPFKRDIMRELSEACVDQGIVPCWYHSIMDWHHPDYAPHRAWSTPVPADASFDRYVDYLHGQVTELLSNYGKVGVMWFDGEWESTWSHERGVPLYNLCRRLQPNVIVNNRVDVGRDGMAGLSTDNKFAGDYGTPEQEVPATGLPGVDWETCMTMNGHWGYNAADKNFKSSKELIQLLCDIVSKGGNFLLNVGPKPDGTFPQESIDRLANIGTWMRKYSASIYGTEASPFKSLPWGRCTQKSIKSGTSLFLQVFDWPTNGRLVLPGIGNRPISAHLLALDVTMPVERQGSDLVIWVPRSAPDSNVTVIRLDVQGKPIVYDAPKIETASNKFVGSAQVSLVASSKELEIRYTTTGSAPTLKSNLYGGKPIKISKDGTVLRAQTFHKGKAVSPIAEMRFTQVEPLPAIDKTKLTPGVVVEHFPGDFNKVADMLKGKPVKTANAPMIELGDLGKMEKFGARFTAILKVPADGLYTFGLLSDDGAQCWIDGHLVVDHDGLHSPTTKIDVAALARGPHKVEVLWFNKTGGSALELSWAQGGDKLRPLHINDLWAGE